ncbi:MAG TPA: hypothetical protein VGK73_25930 [Polyangiaceae bacterium]
MADTTTERLPRYTGEIPHKGTSPIAANTLLFKGQIVCEDADGRANVPGAGRNALGVCAATYNNRTGSPSGGAAGAVDAEIEYGVQGFTYLGTAPRKGQVVYVVDNQTVSLDPAGSRGIAGVCSETKSGALEDGLCYVFMGPLAIAMAQSLQGAQSIDLPLAAFRLASGAAIPAYADGTNGLELADSEALCYRLNDDVATVIWTQARLPESLPAGSTVTLHILASRVGAADAATAAITPSVFANREGVAHNAGAALTSGNFDLLAAATTVIGEYTKAVTGAQAGDVLSVSLAAAAGLDDDDARIHACWISIR